MNESVKQYRKRSEDGRNEIVSVKLVDRVDIDIVNGQSVVI